MLIAAALVLVAACGETVAGMPPAAVPHARPFHPPSTWSLLVSDREAMDGTWRFTQVDAASLRDASPAMTGHGWVVASADGSTMVELDYPSNQPVTVRVIDLRTGRQRSTFHPSVGAGPVLTSDGSRLLVLASSGSSWQLFETSTGRLAGSMQDTANPCCDALDFFIDSTGQFLYRVLLPGSGIDAKGPITPVVVQDDLTAGREIRRLVLNGVQAGLWQGPHLVGTEHVSRIVMPGIALSPDGSRFSVLYGEGSRLLTIDTATLHVLGSPRVVAAQAATSWLPMRPVDAVAKYEEGVQWTLTYSPDGKQLLASARQLAVDSAGNFSHRGLDAKLIDAQTGNVIASVPEVDVDQLLYAPDGSAIYATNRRPDGSMTLMRLDSSNLAVAARRDYSTARTVVVSAR